MEDHLVRLIILPHILFSVSFQLESISNMKDQEGPGPLFIGLPGMKMSHGIVELRKPLHQVKMQSSRVGVH